MADEIGVLVDDTRSNTGLQSSPIQDATAQRLIRASDRLRQFVDVIGRWGSLLIIPLILLTVWDVGQRKLRKALGDTLLGWGAEDPKWLEIRNWLEDGLFQIIPFQSTMLQELEWHFHTGLFALVLGFGYIYNTHVRVDLVRERLSFRKKAWLEFLGSSAFMIPYCLIVIWFAIDFTYESYKVGEISASTVGLTHRWIIKSVLVFGLCVAALAGFAVWLQSVLVLFGPQGLRFHLMAMEWPEEESRVEGKQRITLDDDEPEDAKTADAKPAGATAAAPTAE